MNYTTKLEEMIENKVKDFEMIPIEVFSEVGKYIKDNLKTDLELKEVDISSNDFITRYTKNIFILQSYKLEIVLFISKENEIKLGVKSGLIDKKCFNTINSIINEFEELYLKFIKDNQSNVENNKEDSFDNFVNDLIGLFILLGKGE